MSEPAVPVRYTPLGSGLFVELGPEGEWLTTLIPYERLSPEWRDACDMARADEWKGDDPDPGFI